MALICACLFCFLFLFILFSTNNYTVKLVRVWNFLKNLNDILIPFNTTANGDCISLLGQLVKHLYSIPRASDWRIGLGTA